MVKAAGTASARKSWHQSRPKCQTFFFTFVSFLPSTILTKAAFLCFHTDGDALCSLVMTMQMRNSE
jgi:hypothetical protein